MPFTVSFDSGVAILVGQGDVDFRAWCDALKALRDDPRLQSGMPVLADYREIRSVPPPGEPPRLAHLYAQYLTGHRVAVVVTNPVAFGVTRQVSLLTAGQVRAFTDMSAALQCLAADAVSVKS